MKHERRKEEKDQKKNLCECEESERAHVNQKA